MNTIITKNNRIEKEQVKENVIQAYLPLIREYVEKYYKNSFKAKFDCEDLYQEGYLGLIEAINNYDYRMPFRDWAIKFINNRILNFVSNCHLENDSFERINHNLSNNALINNNGSISPKIIVNLKKHLTEKEFLILNLSYGLNGTINTLEEISCQLKLPFKQIIDIQQKALNKLRNLPREELGLLKEKSSSDNNYIKINLLDYLQMFGFTKEEIFLALDMLDIEIKEKISKIFGDYLEKTIQLDFASYKDFNNNILPKIAFCLVNIKNSYIEIENHYKNFYDMLKISQINGIIFYRNPLLVEKLMASNFFKKLCSFMDLDRAIILFCRLGLFEEELIGVKEISHCFMIEESVIDSLVAEAIDLVKKYMSEDLLKTSNKMIRCRIMGLMCD